MVSLVLLGLWFYVVGLSRVYVAGRPVAGWLPLDAGRLLGSEGRVGRSSLHSSLYCSVFYAQCVDLARGQPCPPAWTRRFFRAAEVQGFQSSPPACDVWGAKTVKGGAAHGTPGSLDLSEWHGCFQAHSTHGKST